MVSLLASLANAANVDATAAQAIAQQFMKQQVVAGKAQWSAPSILQLAYTEPSAIDAAAAAFYVFNTSQSFVIIAGDDRAESVLAYGDKPLDISNVPSNVQFFLDMYKAQVEYLQANPDLEVENHLNAPLKAQAAIEPLLTAQWDQYAPFYNQTPMYNGKHCVTGCAATSLSMVFYYWQYPTQMTPGVPAYVTDSYSIACDSLAPTTFDWANMKDDYSDYTTEQGAAVAELMRYIGQAEEMNYTPESSGTDVDNIVNAVKLFGYDENVQVLYKNNLNNGYANYTDAQWTELILNELNENRPIVYCAYAKDGFSYAGHAFNVDGYDGDGKYHVNFGWSGDGNGYYALHDFTYTDYTFNYYQHMVVGIEPPKLNLKVNPDTLSLTCMAGESATATFTVKGTLLTSDVTLTLSDADGVFAVNPTAISAADAMAGVTVTVTYLPKAPGNNQATITLSTDGLEDKVVVVNGFAPLETVDPVMLPANDAYVTTTSFRAEWTDGTEQEKVASYSLLVTIAPEVTLLDEADFSATEKASGNQASNASQYLPAGWTAGSGFYLDGGCVSLKGTLTSADYAAGYEKLSVVLVGKNYSSSTATLTVATSLGSQSVTLTSEMAEHTVVLDAATTDRITFTASNYPQLQDIKIYGGDITDAASEVNIPKTDSTYRLVEDVTDKYCVVSDLRTAGTFNYRVKALYVDGTESNWSNIETVTLHEGATETHIAGDVNHDGVVDISDVTRLIDRVLASASLDSETSRCCDICCDVNGDGNIDISDVTALIDLVLGGNAG